VLLNAVSKILISILLVNPKCLPSYLFGLSKHFVSVRQQLTLKINFNSQQIMTQNLDSKLANSTLTARWLQDNVKNQLKVDNANITSWTTKSIGGEMGFLSNIFRVTLEWQGEGADKLPKSVVVKVDF
jgi:hypothetical protein